jgi:glycosyltransferase involved in cell wall biosynthesis
MEGSGHLAMAVGRHGYVARAMKRRRRVLVLAYFFPPLGGAGVQRTLKFVRYLEPLGWDATVVTSRSRLYPARDPSLLEDVPGGTRIIRTRALPLASWAGAILYRLRLRTLHAWVTWPDSGKGWAPFACLAALRAARLERPDVIFSTSAPFGAHLVAMWVSRRTGIPWVADFRDEWASNPNLGEPPRSLARLTARSERAITSAACRVVVAADYFRLEGLAPDDPRRRVILNGVDDADLPTTSIHPPTDRFVLANVGTVYDSFDPSAALRALPRLVEQGEIEREQVVVRFVGSIWSDDFEPPRGIRFEQTGYVEHSRAVEEMCMASVLLLYRPRSSLAPSGKLFEYLASGRPILCLTRPDNLAARLVRDWRAGVVADPDDETEIEAALLMLWRRWQDSGLPDQPEVRRRALERYSRQAGAKQLAEVLEDVAHG